MDRRPELCRYRLVGPHTRLAVRIVHRPDGYHGPQGRWDLDRGFRLQVLQAGVFALFLAGGDAPMLQSHAGPEEQAFLLAALYPQPDLQVLEQALQWPARLGWKTGVVALLGDLSQDQRKWRSHAASLIAPEHPCLCAWVLQDVSPYPRADAGFFTPETVLHQWGRVGRRIARQLRWPKIVDRL